MKFEINRREPDRKLIGVLDTKGSGFWWSDPDGVIVYSSPAQRSVCSPHSTLEDILAGHSAREPIYEGDQITITF